MRASLEIQAGKEREAVHLSDTFEAHDMPANELAALCQRLRQLPGLRRVYLVKKQVIYLPEQASYVLGFSISGMFRRFNSKRANEAAAQISALEGFPGPTLIMNIDGDNAAFGKKMAKVFGSVLIK